MGFLSAYSGTHRLDVGGGYGIELKDCLSAVEKQRAEKALTGNPRVDLSGRAEAALDTTAFAVEMVVASIVGWDLDENDGTVWALEPEQVKRANVMRLPAPVFDAVFAAVNASNGPREKTEQVRFPEPGLSSSANGVGRSAELGQLHP